MTQTNKEYAEALFLLSREKDCVNKYSETLGEIKNIVAENPDYLEFLSSPAVVLSERISAISEAFSRICDEYLLNFLKLLCENGRIKELLSCIEEFEYLKTLAENKTTATVFYAYPLDEAQKQALRAKLENKVGKNIDFIFIEDKSLIGGIKVELDGKVIDGSAKHYLNKVKGVISQ